MAKTRKVKEVEASGLAPPAPPVPPIAEVPPYRVGASNFRWNGRFFAANSDLTDIDRAGLEWATAKGLVVPCEAGFSTATAETTGE